MDQIEEKVRVLMYRENSRYTDEQILAILQIPKRTYDRYKFKICVYRCDYKKYK